MLHDLDLYKEYFERLPYRGSAQWMLILSDDRATIKKLEGLLKMTQREAVDDFIEASCWKDDLPGFAGKKGTARDRLNALRRAYLKTEIGRPAATTEYMLLTPLEYDLFRSVFELEQVCTDAGMKKRARVALESAERVARRANVWRQKEYIALMGKLLRPKA